MNLKEKQINSYYRVGDGEADLVSVNNIDFVHLGGWGKEEGGGKILLNVQNKTKREKSPSYLEGGMKKDRGYRKW